MRNLPSLNRLRTFEAAARLHSFSRAAEELHLTASAVSHQIRDLERHFGCALFSRAHRRVETTAEGERLHASLSRVFDALEAACAEVRLPDTERVLAVHCAPSLAVKWLGPRLPRFLARHPDVNVRLTTGAEPMDLGRVREVDVAVAYGSPSPGAGQEVSALGDEHIAPLVAPAALAALGILVPPGVVGGTGVAGAAGAHHATAAVNSAEGAWAAVHALPLIESQLSRLSWPQWFQWHGQPLPRPPRPSFDRAVLAIAAAADGMGIALESTRLAARELERGDLVVLGDGVFQTLARPTHFVSLRAREPADSPARRFAAWLADEARASP